MNEQIKKNTDVEVQILRLEGDCAVLKNGHGEFLWPMSHLPEKAAIGQTIMLTVKNPENEESAKLAALRKLLEELIN